MSLWFMLTAREKKIIENEDPRVLRALLASMAEHIQQQKELIARLEKEKAEKDQSSSKLEEQVKLLRREIFGKSSEKRPERRYVKEIHRRYKYKFIPTDTEALEKEIIITDDGASELLPAMNYTSEFLASAVADKYISHMPLERQTREMEACRFSSVSGLTESGENPTRRLNPQRSCTSPV